MASWVRNIVFGTLLSTGFALAACTTESAHAPIEVGPTASPSPAPTVTPMPTATSAPSTPPSATPASVSTTEAVGAAGSTLTYPTLLGTSAVMTVPPGIVAGSIATLTTTNGYVSGGSNYIYGPIVDTFMLSLNAESGFHLPAIVIRFAAPLTSSENIDVFNGGDYSVFPSGTSPLMVPQSLTCSSLSAGQKLFIEVLSPAMAPTIPTPLAGPATCPV